MELPTQVLNSLRRLVRALRVGSHGLERELGVSGAQLFVLRELAQEPRISLKRLSERTLTDPSSVSVVVARLEERGLVERERNPADLRQSVLSLSPAGTRLLAKAGEPLQARLARAIQALPASSLRRLSADLDFLVREVGADSHHAEMFFDDEPSAKEEPRREPRRKS